MHNTFGKKETLVEFMVGGRIAQAIYAVTKLNIPDILADQNLSVDEVAARAGVTRDALYRVLRMLAGRGIFQENADHTFANSTLSQYLMQNHPDSFRDSVIYRIELGSLAWGEILYSLQTGKPAFDKIFGMPFFQYLNENPTQAEIFNKAMVAQSRKTFQAVLENYDFSSCKTLVDVGGGHGEFVAAFLQKYSAAKAILFDLQSAIDGFDAHAQAHAYAPEVLARLTLQAGDFFAAVPAGGDVYFMKTILHDWEDAEALKILQNIAQKMRPESRLLLVEAILPERCSKDFTFLMDLQMLIQLGGRERTREEFAALLEKTGCVLHKVYDMPGMFKIIEAKVSSLDKRH